MSYLIKCSIALFILCFISQTSCLYLNLFSNKEKCFYDNFYNEMVIILRYSILNEEYKNETLPVNNNRFEVSKYSKEDKKIVNVFHSSKLNGKFSQTIDGSGEYKVCIKSSDRDLFKKRRCVK